MDNRPIGMFDSGVGGITVFRELTKMLPNEDIIYIGDTASFPYGSKSKETIIELSKKRIETLIEKNVKLIIIACGTATSQALEEVQRIYNIPIIGIIEPTAEYLQKEGIKNIGVIATTGTIRSNSWQKALESKIKNCNIKNKACALLAPMAEEGWTTNEIAKLTIAEYIKEMHNVDALILGCTHYPLFQDIIKSELPQGTMVINTGEILARKLKEDLNKNGLTNESASKAKYEIYLTDTECNFINVARNLIQDDNIINNIKKI